MPGAKMHEGEVHTDAAQVRQLLAAQFPQWADLPIEAVLSAGTDNALFRLGDDLAVRMPRINWATGQVEKEQRWLPKLAPLLPLDIPVPLAKGAPGEGYPWDWTICRWLEGESVAAAAIGDMRQAAADLARFIRALQQIDPAGGPPPGEHNSFRGMPLSTRDARVRDSIVAMNGMLDSAAVTAAWETCLAAPEWKHSPVWIHGDLQAGNLLARNGRLCAVIDFGCLGVGDPACELIVAWNFLDAEGREALRSELSIDDATWERGRGWALSVAMIALPYYLYTNPVIVEASWRVLREVLADGA